MVSPITVATQGLLNSPLAVAAVRGRLSIDLLEEVRGGSSDGKYQISPALRAKLLREDEEILAIIISFMESME